MQNFYWVTERVAGGSIPEDRQDYEHLASLGVKVVLSLAEDWEYEYYVGMTLEEVERIVQELGMRLVREPVPDGMAPSPEKLLELARFLTELESSGIKVYVHCVGGLGRTPTVLAAFLMYSRGLDLYTALHRIQIVNPEMTLTDYQLTTLMRFMEIVKEQAKR